MARVKQLNAKLLISAFIISGIIFAAGFYTGYNISNQTLSSIESETQSVNRRVENFQLQFLFIDVLGEKAACPILTSTLADVNKQSYDIGAKLTQFGTSSDIKDFDSYVRIKQDYSRLLTSYWLLATKVKQSCDMNSSTIIYFFSKNCTQCDDQGFILTYLKTKYGDSLLIFALDGDISEPSVDALKEHFSITEYPALIINGGLYNGFYSQDSLEALLNLNR